MGRGDEGSGLFSLAMATLVVLVMVAFAVQLLLGLYTRSVAADAAQRGARRMAGGASVAEAQAAADALLATPSARCQRSPDDEYVSCAVRVRSPSMLGDQWAAPWARGTIERTATVRVEKAR